ncbi:MAG: Beta-glucanase [Owenweeksia sp. TMED14]|nr:MAG: Beta-glucanase [Owenweeksia sp. TMED14]
MIKNTIPLVFLGFGISCQNPEMPLLLVEDAQILERDVNHVHIHTVSISDPFNKDISFQCQTTGVTATEGEDFTHFEGVITIPKGETKAEINVPILTDTLMESDEVIWLGFSNPMNVRIQDGLSEIKIMNDDTFMVNDDTSGYYSPLSYPGKSLVWSEEFDQSSLDMNSWNYETGGYWFNNELQYYRGGTANTALQNGKLVITAKKETYQNREHTSARLTTEGKVEYKYGRIDVRGKFPKGQGIWPAIWLLGNDHSSVGWPACGELDMVELLGHTPQTVHGSINYGPQGNSWAHTKTSTYSLSGEDFSDKYHVFSVLWKENSIQYYVDDNLYATYTPNNIVSGQAWRFNHSFFFILNIAVGGDWPGNPDQTTVFPQQMLIDYIRIFQ